MLQASAFVDFAESTWERHPPLFRRIGRRPTPGDWRVCGHRVALSAAGLANSTKLGSSGCNMDRARGARDNRFRALGGRARSLDVRAGDAARFWHRPAAAPPMGRRASADADDRPRQNAETPSLRARSIAILLALNASRDQPQRTGDDQQRYAHVGSNRGPQCRDTRKREREEHYLDTKGPKQNPATTPTIVVTKTRPSTEISRGDERLPAKTSRL